MDVSAGGPKMGAEILGRSTVGAMDPTDAHPVAYAPFGDTVSQSIDCPDDFVTKHDGKRWGRGSAFDLIQFRVADSAGGHPNPDLAGSRFRNGKFDQFQG
jgi:hypothetical protein